MDIFNKYTINNLLLISPLITGELLFILAGWLPSRSDSALASDIITIAMWAMQAVVLAIVMERGYSRFNYWLLLVTIAYLVFSVFEWIVCRIPYFDAELFKNATKIMVCSNFSPMYYTFYLSVISILSINFVYRHWKRSIAGKTVSELDNGHVYIAYLLPRFPPRTNILLRCVYFIMSVFNAYYVGSSILVVSRSGKVEHFRFTGSKNIFKKAFALTPVSKHLFERSIVMPLEIKPAQAREIMNSKLGLQWRPWRTCNTLVNEVK